MIEQGDSVVGPTTLQVFDTESPSLSPAEAEAEAHWICGIWGRYHFAKNLQNVITCILSRAASPSLRRSQAQLGANHKSATQLQLQQ